MALREQDGFGEREGAHLALVKRQVLEHQNPLAWQKLDECLPEALWALERLIEKGKGYEARWLLDKLDVHLWRRSRYAEYEQVTLRVIELLKPGSWELAQQLGNLGHCYETLDDLPKAIDYHERVLAINEKLPDIEGQRSNLGHLACCYAALGETEKGIGYLRRSASLERLRGTEKGTDYTQRPNVAYISIPSSLRSS